MTSLLVGSRNAGSWKLFVNFGGKPTEGVLGGNY